MEASGDALVEQAVHGDRDALVALLRLHGPSARRKLAGRIPKRWQAVLTQDDVMQQTYADASTNIERFHSTHEAAFAKWLAMIAQRNLSDAVKLLETSKRGGDRLRVEGADDESFAALWEVLAVSSGTPSKEIAGDEAKAALKHAIAQLPEAYARVVLMYDIEGRPVKEVAETLQRTPGAVFMLRARAHDRLHELMGRTSKFFSA